jgi:hypothetical protein
MAYKRYIKKNGKVYGPYVYKSVRDDKGNVKNIYVGRGSGERSSFASRLSSMLPFRLFGSRMAVVLLLVIISTSIMLAYPGSATFDRLTVQGQLRDSSNSVLSGTYNFSFSVYTQFTGGTYIFQKNVTDVYVDQNGLYTAIITGMNLPFDADYYLGIAVNDDAEMTPRLNITDMGTAFRSNRTEYLGSYGPSYYLNTSTETQTVGGNLSVTNSINVSEGGIVLGGVYRKSWPAGAGNTTAEMRTAINGSDTWVNSLGIGTQTLAAFLEVDKSLVSTGTTGLIVDISGSTDNTVKQVGIDSLAEITNYGNPTYTIGTKSMARSARRSASPFYGVHSTAEVFSTDYDGTSDNMDLYAYYGFVNFSINNIATKTIDDMYGAFLTGYITSGGTVDDYYGLYLDTPTVSGTLGGRYGIYQEDTNADNYFGGKVSIGTTSAATLLDISGGGSDNLLNITDGGNDVMYIDSSGRVGIGTTSPGTQFEVSDGTYGITLDPNDGSNSYGIINTTGDTNLTIHSSGGSVIIKLG